MYAHNRSFAPGNDLAVSGPRRRALCGNEAAAGRRYSYRSACVGSMREARSAGNQAASVVDANVAGTTTR